MVVDDLLTQRAEQSPGQTALVAGGSRCSYGELDERANRVAHALITSGVGPGDRVAICLGNSIDAVVAMFAVLKAGAVFVFINPLSRADRVSNVLADCAATTLIGSPRSAAARRGVKVFPSCDAPAHPGSRPAQSHRDDDLAALVYTSGSTGEAKGVMLTHRNLLAAADSIRQYLALTDGDVILSALPLAFTYGLGQITTAFGAGATVVLEPSSVYPRVLVETLVRERVTGFPIVPTMATLILQQDLTGQSFPDLRYITNAAAALSNVKIQQLRRAFPTAQLVSMYGQTECQRASYLPPDQIDARPASVGVAIPGTGVWIVDAEGNRVAPGGIGELVVSGPHVMKGYWNRPDETARVLRRDDRSSALMLHTGDLFRMDRDGFLYFVDRLDDIIKSRGEKVAPREIEDVIAGLPGVTDVSVYGVPDDVLGEAVAASVAVRPGSRLTGARIQRHCLEHLEAFMVPRDVDIRETLPTTLNGKVSRRALRAAAMNRDEASA